MPHVANRRPVMVLALTTTLAAAAAVSASVASAQPRLVGKPAAALAPAIASNTVMVVFRLDHPLRRRANGSLPARVTLAGHHYSVGTLRASRHCYVSYVTGSSGTRPLRFRAGRSYPIVVVSEDQPIFTGTVTVRKAAHRARTVRSVGC